MGGWWMVDGGEMRVMGFEKLNTRNSKGISDAVMVMILGE